MPVKHPEIEESVAPLNFTQWLRANQNVVFFVLLTIVLLTILFVWRSVRTAQMGDKAAAEMDRVQGSESLAQMLTVHRATKAAPLIQLKLANAYFDEAKYIEAKKEYQGLITQYPNHEAAKLAQTKLKTLDVNEQWQKSELDKRIKELLAKRSLPNVTVKTNMGDFEMELFEDDAPNTTANFLALAEKNGYNTMPFVDNRPDLGVCLGERGPAASAIPFELNNLKHKEGTVGMIRTIDPNANPDIKEDTKYLNSASTRFYICTRPEASELNGKYTVFGQVTRGMDVAKKLSRGSEISRITVNYKRSHLYEPQTVPVVSLPERGMELTPPPPPAPPVQTLPLPSSEGAHLTPTPPAPPTISTPITPTQTAPIPIPPPPK